MSTAQTKPFQWSYSALKNFSTCPRRHYHYDIAKTITEPESEQLRQGHDLHAHFEARLMRKTPLPLGYGHYEKLLAKFDTTPGTAYGEQKLAITAEFQPTSFFAPDVWFRTVVDYAIVNGDRAAIFDWKSGKPQDDPTQLRLMAATLFVHMPTLERVRAALVFVAYSQLVCAEFARSDQGAIWNELLPRVRELEKARKLEQYPPKPSGLCMKYCAVSSCEFFGKGGRG